MINRGSRANGVSPNLGRTTQRAGGTGPQRNKASQTTTNTLNPHDGRQQYATAKMEPK
jgi:hypothetical protein